MNPTFWVELKNCFEVLDSNPEARAIIISGNGSNFCAGLDLEMFGDLYGGLELPSRRAEYFRKSVLASQSSLTALEKCRKPVLAAVHGACIGGGLDLVCCADMRFVSDCAYFSVREIDLGMTADVGTLQRLPRLISDGLARELAYTGRNMYAAESKSAGFSNEIFAEKEKLLEGVMCVAQAIAAKSPLAIRGSKEMLLYSRDHSIADGLNYIATWNAGMLCAADLQEGIDAQRNRRNAVYQD